MIETIEVCSSPKDEKAPVIADKRPRTTQLLCYGISSPDKGKRSHRASLLALFVIVTPIEVLLLLRVISLLEIDMISMGITFPLPVINHFVIVPGMVIVIVRVIDPYMSLTASDEHR